MSSTRNHCSDGRIIVPSLPSLLFVVVGVGPGVSLPLAGGLHGQWHYANESQHNLSNNLINSITVNTTERLSADVKMAREREVPVGSDRAEHAATSRSAGLSL